MILVDFLKDLAVILASCTAIYGISSWRREFVGRRKIETAEEVLSLFYEARDAIRFMRSPAGHIHEGKTRKAEEYESPEEKERKDRAFILIERYNTKQELFGKIYALRYRFMAQFGGNAARPFDELHGIIIDLISSSHQLANIYEDYDSDQQQRKNRRRELEKMFWTGFEDDPMSPRVDAVVESVEIFCRDAMKERTSGSNLLDRIWSGLKDLRR